EQRRIREELDLVVLRPLATALRAAIVGALVCLIDHSQCVERSRSGYKYVHPEDRLPVSGRFRANWLKRLKVYSWPNSANHQRSSSTLSRQSLVRKRTCTTLFANVSASSVVAGYATQR